MATFRAVVPQELMEREEKAEMTEMDLGETVCLSWPQFSKILAWQVHGGQEVNPLRVEPGQ